jgi:hypothetical protein
MQIEIQIDNIAVPFTLINTESENEANYQELCNLALESKARCYAERVANPKRQAIGLCN